MSGLHFTIGERIIHDEIQHLHRVINVCCGDEAGGDRWCETHSCTLILETLQRLERAVADMFLYDDQMHCHHGTPYERNPIGAYLINSCPECIEDCLKEGIIILPSPQPKRPDPPEAP